MATPDTTLAAFATRDYGINDQPAYPVVIGNLLVGLVSIDEIRRVPTSRWMQTETRQVMRLRHQFEVIGPKETLAQGLQKLQQAAVPLLPVLEATNLIGALWYGDVIKFISQPERRPSAPPHRAPQRPVVIAPPKHRGEDRPADQ